MKAKKCKIAYVHFFQVKIQGLYSSDNDVSISLDRPIKSVALEPDFSKTKSRQFVTGDERLLLNEKSFLKGNKTTMLHQGEGPVRNIKWKGTLIAWANNHVSYGGPFLIQTQANPNSLTF